VGDADLGLQTEQRAAGDDIIGRVVAEGLRTAELLDTVA
jgi:hypothetical protein